MSFLDAFEPSKEKKHAVVKSFFGDEYNDMSEEEIMDCYVDITASSAFDIKQEESLDYDKTAEKTGEYL